MGDDQVLEEQQQNQIEALIAQEAPGKDSDEAADSLQATLEAMNDGDLLELIQQAYREDPENNSLLLQKATSVLEGRGKGDAASDQIKTIRSENYRELLGEFLGGELYDLLADQTNEEALLEHGKSALDGALGSIEGLVGMAGLEGDQEAHLTKFAEALATDGLAEVEKFLESEKGAALLGKISRWVDEHPGYVLLIGVLAAAGAVAADLDIPALKAKFNLTEGLSAEVAAELGSIRHIALESAKLDLKYVRGQFTATAGVEHEAGKGQSYSGSLRYGDEENFIETTGALDPEGKLVIGLNAAIRAGLLTATATGQSKVDEEEHTGAIEVKYGTEDANIGTSGTVDAEGNLTLDVSSHLEQGMFSGDVTGQYGTENDDYQLGSSLRYGTEDRNLTLGNTWDGQHLDTELQGNYRLNQGFGLDLNMRDNQEGTFGALGSTNYFEGGSHRSYIGNGEQGMYGGNTLNYAQGGTSIGLDTKDQGLDGSVDAISLSLGLQPSELARFSLDYGRSLDGAESAHAMVELAGDSHSGSVSYGLEEGQQRLGGTYKSTFAENWEADIAATYNLTANDLESVSLGLGFRDPDEFRAFSLDFSRGIKGDHTETELSTMFEANLGKFMIRNTLSTGFQDSTWRGVENTTHVARPINNNWTAIAGSTLQYDNLNGGGFNAIPQVGVQYKQIPITIGYDINARAPVIGITIPFGRR
jgi:hypothetical protein